MSKSLLYLFFVLFIFSFMFFNYRTTDKVFAGQELENAQADRAKLERDLANLEIEIAEKQKELSSQKGKSNSLSGDIKLLSIKINKAKLDIKSKGLIITKLGGEINEKNKKISILNNKIDNIRESLAQLIRKNREIDDKSILGLLLSKSSISEAYGDIETFSSIKKSINDSVNEIRGIKSLTEEEKIKLEEKKNKEIDTKFQLETSKKAVEINEKEKQELLSISKNKESEYQKLLNEKAKRRAEILTMLFSLRDVSAIPFAKALEYSNLASSKTGIRPAFLLAILTQESNLGANQGSCYLTNIETGAGISSKSGKVFSNVMKPTRDIKPFFDITTSVGRDPYKTLISCPFGNVGYGGAMGPSQFIPSTWQIIKGRVASMLGIVNADPWNPKDAFIASAIYLTDLGAKKDSYTSERNAACKYYSGRICDSKKPANSFYGDSVIKKAKSIQENYINPLQN